MKVGAIKMAGKIVGMFGYSCDTKSYVQDAWHNFNPSNPASATNKAWEIDKGAFMTDPNKSIGGRIWEFISRWTWQLPQTLVGYWGATISNLAGKVESVQHYGGATVIQSTEYFGAVTLGNYIIGGYNIQADPTNRLFQHEYGHYIQSQQIGLLYLGSYGFTSLASAWLPDDGHNRLFVEQDANALAYAYFRKYVDNFGNTAEYGHYNDWKFDSNPIFGHDAESAQNLNYNTTNFFGVYTVSIFQVIYRTFAALFNLKK